MMASSSRSMLPNGNDDQHVSTARHRRRSAALSCAECRRLKLRCSRTFPCTNCVRKGVGAICPDGSLTTGKGNRFVLANTEALHEKIGQLSNRVRQLEDALAQSHSMLSNDPHPLLSEELLLIKRPLEREKTDTAFPPVQDKDSEDATDAIGSLSISEYGRASFFGQTANAWYLLQNEEGGEDDDDENAEAFGRSLPFALGSSQTMDDIRQSLASLIPRESAARRITQIYYRHAAWMYTPIPEDEFQENIHNRIYHSNIGASPESVDSHVLAVLFLVLALGTLLDLDQPSHPAEATHFYQLGRAALAVDSVLEVQSITAIQGIFLLCHYMFLSGIEGARWVLMGLVVKLAHSVGLHRDPIKWHLGLDDTHKRRALMWEIYTYDSWQSLTFGRPPSFSLVHIDTQLPHETSQGGIGDVEMSFAAWKHRFSSQCLSIVHDQAFGARAPNYKTIQELDKKVKEFYVPPSLQVPGFGGAKPGNEVEQPSIQLTMQRYIAFAIREITLFYMHRGFFARAVEEHPDDPLGSKYGPSVLAAYTSACSFVGLIESLYSQHPRLTERMWFLFTHVFSCAIVLGSIATKPRMALAPSALLHLDGAYNLFNQVADNPRTAKVLPILQRLRERAKVQTETIMPAGASSYYGPQIKNESDEFTALGGTTRLVSRKTSSLPSSPLSSGRGSYPASSPASQHSRPVVHTPPAMEIAVTPNPEAGLISWQSYNPLPAYTQYPYQEPPLQTYQTIESQYMSPQENTIESTTYPGSFYNPAPSGGYMHAQYVTANIPTGELHDPNASWQHFMAQFKSV